MRKPFLLITLLFFNLFIKAQNNNQPVHRLKVFIDCNNTRCDQTFIKTEINIVDFLLDNQAADLHILITEQETGGGGSQFQLIFFGQNRFKQMTDTLRFNTDPNATDFEERDLLIKHLKLGLTPYIVKAGNGNDIAIEMKTKTDEKKNDTSTTTKDPWNYWVFRVGANGYMNADEVYKSSRAGANIAANRVTEEIKVGFEARGGKNRDSYYLEDSAGKQKIVNKNEDYYFQHYLIKSISDHWSYGYQVELSRSSFSNNKGRLLFRTGFEYDIYPYKDVNTKFFTVSYTVDVRRNSYFDTTLYDKLKETLYGQSVEANLSFRQKWGTIEFGIDYHNYFHDWKYLNLGANGGVDIRITGGLSVNFYAYAELSRDQIYLPKEEADITEVLTRRRQIASGYNFYTSFGLNYRFGSKLNNFVNPRFD
jgi:hypothetical protein